MPISQPAVTVVIAGAENAGSLIECVRSVDKQTHDNKRIVFIDDAPEAPLHRAALSLIYRPFQQVQQDEIWAAWGNTNEHKTPLLINRFGNRVGKAFAKNWGLKQSWDETDLYLFLDGDEVLAEDCLSEFVTQFLKHPETIGALYSNQILLDNGQEREMFLPSYRRDHLVKSMASPVIMAAKSAIDSVGIFDVCLPALNQYDMLLRISEHFNIAHIPEVLLSKPARFQQPETDEIQYLRQKTEKRMNE